MSIEKLPPRIKFFTNGVDINSKFVTYSEMISNLLDANTSQPSRVVLDNLLLAFSGGYINKSDISGHFENFLNVSKISTGSLKAGKDKDEIKAMQNEVRNYLFQIGLSNK